VRIEEIIWLDAIVEKLAVKHRVQPEEVEEVLEGRSRFRFVEKGDREGEDVYLALGQTYAGRYLVVFFVYKAGCQALVLSARDMVDKERKQYGRK
jgi:uncharacterized protein